MRIPNSCSWLSLCFALALPLSACAADPLVPTSRYTEATADFRKGVESAAKLIRQQLEVQANTRRLLAVQDYLDHPKDPNLDLDRRNVAESFARYMCLGLDETERDADALAYLAAYGDALADIGRQPDRNVAAMWENIRRLRGAGGALPFKPAGTENGQAQRCRAEVLQLRAMSLPRAEKGLKSLAAASSLFEAFNALVEAVKAASVAVAAPIDEQARKEAFRKFVVTNAATLHGVLDDPRLDADLYEMWMRRRQALLVLPYERFAAMMATKPADRLAIVEAAAATNRAAADFDAERCAQPPLAVLKALREAQARLEKAAADPATQEEAWGELRSFAETLQAIAAAIDAVQARAQAVKAGL
ncbi:MAG TPA: hypothetical protein VF816_09760 [Rhodocyclaceae bacterium]